MVFVLTYGFVGLEVVAIELDNPFGEDENDFNNSALAMTAYEDIYLTVADTDGAEWADKLRVRMHDSASQESLPTEQSWLLSKIV
jgi:predicted membrane chloride channel (bestrophin family)